MFWTSYPHASFDARDDYRVETDPFTDVPHFVGNLEHIKQLFRVIFADEDTDVDGITVHKLGSTLVFDDAPQSSRMDESIVLPTNSFPVLIPSSELLCLPEDKKYLGPFGTAKVKNTFLHVETGYESDEPLKRTTSAPTAVTNFAKDRASDFAALTHFAQGTLSIPQSVPYRLSRSQKSVTWHLGGFSLLLGCEFLTASSPSLISLKILEGLRPSKAQRSDAWVENSILAIPKVAWAADDGNLSVCETSTLLDRELTGLLHLASRLLSFLMTTCTDQGGVYYLCREGGECRLYSSPDLQPVADRLREPIASLCLKLARKSNGDDKLALLRKAHAMGDEISRSAIAQEMAAAGAPEALRLLVDCRSSTPAGTELAQNLEISFASAALSRDCHVHEKIALLLEALRRLDFVDSEKRAVECLNLEISILRKLAASWRFVALHHPNPNFVPEFPELQFPGFSGFNALQAALDALDRALILKDDLEISTLRAALYVDCAEYENSRALKTNDRKALASARSFCAAAVAAGGEAARLGRLSFAKNLKAEASLLKVDWYGLSRLAISMLRGFPEIEGGEHFLVGQRLLSGPGGPGNFFGDLNDELDHLCKNLTDAPADAEYHFKASLRLCADEQVISMSKLELAKLYSSGRESQRKLAVRYAESAYSFFLAQRQPDILREAAQLFAALLSATELMRGFRVLVEAEIALNGDKELRSFTCEMAKSMLKQVSGKLREAVSTFYRNAIWSLDAKDLLLLLE